MSRLTLRAHPSEAPRQIPRWTARFWHDDTAAGAGYHGLMLGRDHGYTSADVNVNACKVGRLKRLIGWLAVFINTHWIDTGHDHWRSKLVRGNVKLRTLTWRQVKRLRSPGGFRIRRLGQVIKRAKRLGYTHLELELKDGVDWLTHKELVRLIRKTEKQATRVGISIYWKTLSNIGNPLKRMRAVHDAGGVSVLLPRDNPHLPAAEWWPVTDYVRGHVTWTHTKEAA